MPIYEYRCATCQQKSSFFVRSMGAALEAVCPQCASSDMRRVISAVSFRASAKGSSEMDYYKDPSNIGRHVEDSFAKYDVEMPESVRRKIEDARRGKVPEDLGI